MRRVARFCVVMAAIGTLALLSASGASAASGEITKAVASQDWSNASFAGSVEESACKDPPISPKPPGTTPWGPENGAVYEPCSWRAYLTVAPGSDPDECTASTRRWSSLGPQVVLAWTSGEQRAAATLAFDVSGVTLAGGEPQLACLSLTKTVPEFVACAAVMPIDGSPYYCPPYVMLKRFYSYDVAMLSTEPPPKENPPTEAVLPAPGANQETPAVLPPHKPKCMKKKKPHRAVSRAGHRCGKKHSGPRGHKRRQKEIALP